MTVWRIFGSAGRYVLAVVLFVVGVLVVGICGEAAAQSIGDRGMGTCQGADGKGPIIYAREQSYSNSARGYDLFAGAFDSSWGRVSDLQWFVREGGGWRIGTGGLFPVEDHLATSGPHWAFPGDGGSRAYRGPTYQAFDAVPEYGGPEWIRVCGGTVSQVLFVRVWGYLVGLWWLWLGVLFLGFMWWRFRRLVGV